MRASHHALLAFVFFGCSTDTFAVSDGGADAASDAVSDGPNAGEGSADVVSEAAPTPIDPNSLGQDLVLWLRAEDATVDTGLDIVTGWPDKSPAKQMIKLKTNSASACSPAGVHMNPNEVNGKPAASFCDGDVEAADATSLQFGSSDPFVVATVIEPGNPSVPDNYILASKSTNPTGQTGFAFIAPNNTSQIEAYLKLGDTPVVAPTGGAGQYHVVTLVRRAAGASSALILRIDGVATPATVTSESVSEVGAPFAIGAFDTGTALLHLMPGKLAEILVVTSATTLGDAVPAGIDLYLKQKYNL